MMQAHDQRDHGFDRDNGGAGGNFGRRGHKRPVTDYGSSIAKWMATRQAGYRGQSYNEIRPFQPYLIDMLPPPAYLDNPALAICTKHAHASLNKIKHPINVVKWTPEGRRLLTGSSSGEFTLWNGMGFNFETIMQAHDCAIRVAQYSHADDWLLSGDQDGIVKYWQPNFNNVKVLQAHNEPVRDLSFSPTDAKFVTASDDGTLKIWNFNEGREERTLTGHGWDVKCCDWHPSKGLVVSGSKDHLVKLWDPRSARCLTTLHGHKNTITKSLFQPNRGDLLATSSRDQTSRIFELRMMKDFCVLRGHQRDISTLAWHPIQPSIISTGGSDGAIMHYILDEAQTSTRDSAASATILMPASEVPYAHEYAVWSMEYHPLGHIFASGSNDRITRFWVRPRPGDVECFKDRFHIGEPAAEALGIYDRSRRRRQEEEEAEDEADALIDQKMPIPGQANGSMYNLPNGAVPPGLPGLGDLSALMAGGFPPPPPPPPGMAGMPHPPLPGGVIPPGLLPFPPPGGAALPGLGSLPPPPPLPGLGTGNIGGGDAQAISQFLTSTQNNMQNLQQASSNMERGGGGSSGGYGGGHGPRRRAPLPSQQDIMPEATRGYRRNHRN